MHTHSLWSQEKTKNCLRPYRSTNQFVCQSMDDEFCSCNMKHVLATEQLCLEHLYQPIWQTRDLSSSSPCSWHRGSHARGCSATHLERCPACRCQVLLQLQLHVDAIVYCLPALNPPCPLTMSRASDSQPVADNPGWKKNAAGLNYNPR